MNTGAPNPAKAPKKMNGNGSVANTNTWRAIAVLLVGVIISGFAAWATLLARAPTQEDMRAIESRLRAVETRQVEIHTIVKTLLQKETKQ